jgi:hypothetical protein
MLEPFVTKKQLAAALHVTERCVDLWVRRKLLPVPIKLGGTNQHFCPQIAFDWLAGDLGSASGRGASPPERSQCDPPSGRWIVDGPEEQ